MQVNLIRLKGVERQLASIEAQLARIADCLEADLGEKGVFLKAPKADLAGEAPGISFTDEEVDWARENVPNFDKLAKDFDEQ